MVYLSYLVNMSLLIKLVNEDQLFIRVTNTDSLFEKLQVLP